MLIALGFIALCWYFSLLSAATYGESTSNAWAISYTISWLIDTLVTGSVVVILKPLLFYQIKKRSKAG